MKTEYRLVGEEGAWADVPAEGLNLQTGEHIIAFRSIDSAGVLERSDAIEWTRETPSVKLLQAWIDRYVEWGWIDNEGVASSLRAKLDKGNLRPFLNEVQAQSEQHIHKEAADYLLRDAEAIELSE